MKKTSSTTIGALLGTSLMLAPLFALAQAAGVNTSVNANATTPVANVQMSASAMTAAKARADRELDRRVGALTDAQVRVQAMQKVTPTFKDNISTALEAQISAFNALNAKIQAETDAATLKADVQSITESYRVYALVLPQVRIAAAADRLVTVTTMMQTLGTKLAARVQAAGNAGADITALTATVNDLGSKITSANTSAQAAVSVSAALVPDQGDKQKMAENAAVLKDARAKLTAAHADLKAARKDIDTLVKGLKKVEATLTASSTTSVQ